MGRRWTEDETDLLRKWYPQYTVQSIAEAMQRSRASVFQRASSLGLTVPFTPWPPKLKQLIRRRNKAGYLDREIAIEWSRENPDRTIDRRTLCNLRREMGLTGNVGNARYRQRVAEHTRRQLKRAGLKSLAELRSQSHRKFVERRGWPSFLTIRESQILDLLYERGPQTRKAIAENVGMRTDKNQRNWLSSKYHRGSYLANLLALGLVVKSQSRCVSGEGKGQSVYLYGVAPSVVRGGDFSAWEGSEEWSIRTGVMERKRAGKTDHLSCRKSRNKSRRK